MLQLYSCYKQLHVWLHYVQLGEAHVSDLTDAGRGLGITTKTVAIRFQLYIPKQESRTTLI